MNNCGFQISDDGMSSVDNYCATFNKVQDHFVHCQYLEWTVVYEKMVEMLDLT